ncbi:MAG: nitroreductase family protein [Oscillochloridaceae bacterium]|nr:nitroreductase family protein [Chloroflexaceae bacterium]MDW8389661.1 nitroreductase family protein [Oscillochloridaceae bacterium]
MIQPASDPFGVVAAAATEHMNRDHADAVLAYARGLAGLEWAETARISAITAEGLELHVEGHGQTAIARILFDAPLTDPDHLRPTLIALVQRARRVVSEADLHQAPPPQRDPDLARRLFNVIATRRSFRLEDLSPEPVESHLVTQMLEAANWAPSHGRTEPWRFVVYTGTARRIIGDAFAVAYRQLHPDQPAGSPGEQARRERVWQAPVWIALGMRPDPKMPEWEELIAFGCAVHNMHLMASALGLAGKWSSAAWALHQHVAEVVGFGPETRLYGFFYVGRPAVPWPEGRRRSIVAKVRWIHEDGNGIPSGYSG